jgi:hypothetical protein
MLAVGCPIGDDTFPMLLFHTYFRVLKEQLFEITVTRTGSPAPERFDFFKPFKGSEQIFGDAFERDTPLAP